MDRILTLNPEQIIINYNFSWFPLIAGVGAAFAVIAIVDIAKKRIPFLQNESNVRFVKVFGAVVVMTAATVAPVTVILIALTTALIVKIKYHNTLDSSSGDRLSLPHYLTDMTEAARNNPRKKYIGIDQAIDEIEEILNRDEIRNAVVVGGAGSGKTVILETIAERIAFDEFPENSPYYKKRVVRLSMKEFLGGSSGDSLFGGGTSLRGQLAAKLNELVKAIAGEETILVIDEMHMIQSTDRFPSENMADLLKDVLDRDKVRVIGATTRREYDDHIACNGPLARRFARVDLKEPDEKTCFKMFKAQRPNWILKHPSLTITDGAIAAAIIYAHRYQHKSLPHGASSLIDTIISSLSLQHQNTLDIQQVAEYCQRLVSRHCPRFQPRAYLEQASALLQASVT